MLRILFINALMFLLPFVVYGAYFYLMRKDSGKLNYWSEVPLLWLLGTSTLLVVAAMVTLVSFSGGDPDGKYISPRLENGVIQPGRIE